MFLEPELQSIPNDWPIFAWSDAKHMTNAPGKEQYSQLLPIASMAAEQEPSD